MHYKRLSKQILCALLGTAMIFNTGGLGTITSLAATESDYTRITVDGDIVDPVNVFRGFGAVTCNNTSRLLMDYKEEHPDKYWEIMELLFNPEKGAGINHIKIEMGADVNSSSGTEPATMRSADESANVLRGAGWQFAADAKKINPDITVGILRWGEPKWTQEGTGYEAYANPKYEARYQWYKQSIDAFYDEFGYKVDYVSPGQNERRRDYNDNTEFIRYFAKRLIEDASKEDARYDYNEIQIIAADTHSNSQEIANRMLSDSELMDLIDVVADHYTLYGNDALSQVNQEYGKEVWYDEAVAPQINADDRINVDPARGGVGGTGSMADIATRFINMYQYAGAGENPARMTRFSFQPAVAAFYEGSSYNPKQLLGAFDPWSGYYEADGGLQAVGHFMEFAEVGWEYLPEACYGDGNYTDGGVVVDTGTNNYLTLKDPETDDYSMIFANNTSQTRKYEVTVKNLDKADSTLNVWETRGPDEGEPFDANWMQNVDTITPSKTGTETYTFYLTVQPYSIVTVTSLLDKGVEYTSGQNDSGVERTVLELPYTDDFEYTEYALDEKGRTYLERRGGTPRYTTDQYGAFEVEKDKTGNHVLTQVINDENRPYDWNVWGNGTDESNQTTGMPRTILGDHRWTNYMAGVDFKLDIKSPDFKENYAGIGVREVVHNGTSANDTATYTFRVFEDGSYELYCVSGQKENGKIENFDPSIWHKMQLKADGNVITAYVDGAEVVKMTDENHTSMSGRMTIVSGFYNTQYDNLEVLPLEGKAYAATEKLDDTSAQITWNGNWKHVLNEGYAHYNRTRTYGGAVEKGVYNYDYGQIRYFKGGNPLPWDSGYGNAWGSASDQAHYEFDFYGSGIEIYGEVNANNGTGDVFIDGEPVGTVNYNSSNGGTGRDVFAQGLDPNTRHTLKVVATQGTISLQKLVVIDEPDNEETDIANSFEVTFNGTGINVFGNSGAATLKVEVDGQVVEEGYETPATGNRQTSYTLQGLAQGEHTVKVTVTGGTYYVDGIDLIGEPAEGQTMESQVLQKYLEFAKALKNEEGTYTEEQWNKLQEEIAKAEAVLAGEDEAAKRQAYLDLRNYVDSITPDLAEETAEEITTVTTPYETPDLPEQVNVILADGTQKELPVTWDVAAAMFKEAWTTVSVTGKVQIPDTEKTVTVKALVEVVPEGLVYFIDSGYKINDNETSEEYELIKTHIDTLKNETADQITDGNSWGYVNDGISIKNVTDYSKESTGLYAGSNKDIVYKLPLEAGTYDFTGGFREWWGQTRPMSVTVTYPVDGGTQSQEIGAVALSGSNSNVELSGTVTIPEDGVVEYRVKKTGTQDPVISYLIVNSAREEMSGEALGLSMAVTGEEDLPDTVTIGETDHSVTWKVVSGDWSVTGSVMELEGTADGIAETITWNPVVYSPSQVYFIDSGSETVESPYYEAVKANTELANETQDQKYEDGQNFGYVESQGIHAKGTGSIDASSLLDTGFYGENPIGSSFEYKLTLDAGEYNVTTGHMEWWPNKTRYTQVTASYESAEGVQEVELGTAGWTTTGPAYVEGHLSIPEDGTVVTLKFTNVKNTQAACVSYISVEEGEAEIPEPKTINKIKVDTMPNKTVYAIGEEFDPTGLVVQGYNGTEYVRDLQLDELVMDPINMEETGSTRLTISYTNEDGKEMTAIIRVVVYDPEDMYAHSIKVVTPPDTTVYEQNDSFDPSGMEVRLLMKATSSDAIPESVDSLEYGDYQVKYDFSEAGKQKVTVVYSYFTEDNEEKELEDTVSVYVLDETKDYYDCGIEITKEPNTKVYETGSTFDPEGMEVNRLIKATGSNAIRAEKITGYEISNDTFDEAGQQKVTISYVGTGSNGEEKTFTDQTTVTVTDSRIEVINGQAEAAVEQLMEVFDTETEDYRTKEEKRQAVNRAVDVLVSVAAQLKAEENGQITREYLECLAQVEAVFNKAYGEITSRIAGDLSLTEKAEAVGLLLNFVRDLENQVVELKIVKAAMPEKVEEGKIASAMEITLTAGGESVENPQIPVQITMKIPEGLYEKNLLIWHYLTDGTKEVIIPEVKDGFMTFMADSFGVFAAVSDDETPVSPEKEVSRIEITSLPNKTSYRVGQEFDPAGMVVTAFYTDGTEEIVTAYTVSGFDSAVAGTKTITVSYEGKTAEFTVTVTRSSSGSGSSAGSGVSRSTLTSREVAGTWHQDSNGWWYEKASGGYLKSQWGLINGKWYHFNAEGYAETGWIVDGNVWYYLDRTNCHMKTGWHQDDQDGFWYYLDLNTGAMKLGWQQIDGKWYYFKTVPASTGGWSYDSEKEEWNYGLIGDRTLGSMYANATTPDGYQVGEDGAWLQ